MNRIFRPAPPRRRPAARLLALAAVLCLTAGLAACGSAREEPFSTAPAESAAPAENETRTGGILSSFTARDLAGNTVTEEILEGHPLTMVNVWATFCSPCIQEMPELGELAEEYEAKGVRIVGMVSDVWDSEGAIDPAQVALAQEIVDTTGAEYLHFIPGEDLYGLLYQITSVPTTFFVDEEGRQVGSAYLGAREKEAWAEILDQMLTEVAG